MTDIWVGCYNSGETREEKGQIANAAQAELLTRYEKYYKAWDDDENAKGGLALSFEMSQFFFPKHKPVIDFFLRYKIQVRFGAFMVSLGEFRMKFEIVDQ